MRDFIKEASGRWKADTPGFFKKVIIGGISVGGFGGSLKGIASIPGVVLPHIISDHIGHMITAGLVSAAVAKFAKLDVPSIPGGLPGDSAVLTSKPSGSAS